MVLSLRKSLSAVFCIYERLGRGGLAVLRALLTPALSCSAVLLSSFLATASVEATPLIDRHTLSIFSDKPLTYGTHRVLFSLLSSVFSLVLGLVWLAVSKLLC